MILKLLLGTIKLVGFSTVVLLIAQIPVGSARICEHVHKVTRTQLVQGPIHWVSTHFAHNNGKIKANPSSDSKKGTGLKQNESNESRLSGLLK